MNRKVFFSLLIAALVIPGLAGAVTQEDFRAETTQNLLNLCSVSAEDPLYNAAIHFCHGYLVGAYDYYAAASSGSEGKKLVCFPDPAPSRNDGIAMFVEWAKAHPEYLNEKPVETEFRFLIDKWPCKE